MNLVNEVPDKRTVKSRLEKKYREDILIAETTNKKTVICFKPLDTRYLMKTDMST